MKKVEYCSLPIFGLLKVTEMLDLCEVCPSWPTKKADKYKAKTRNSEKAHTQGRSSGSCHFLAGLGAGENAGGAIFKILKNEGVKFSRTN